MAGWSYSPPCFAFLRTGHFRTSRSWVMPNRPGWRFNSRRLPTPPRRPELQTGTPPQNEVLEGPHKVIHHAPLSDGGGGRDGGGDGGGAGGGDGGEDGACLAALSVASLATKRRVGRRIGWNSDTATTGVAGTVAGNPKASPKAIVGQKRQVAAGEGERAPVCLSWQPTRRGASVVRGAR